MKYGGDCEQTATGCDNPGISQQNVLKIEANESKDYIPGFIFYKILSDNEIKHLKKEELCL